MNMQNKQMDDNAKQLGFGFGVENVGVGRRMVIHCIVVNIMLRSRPRPEPGHNEN